MTYYEMRHSVSFEDTNLIGNVYYVNHLKWQGRCRELFLRDHAPGILEDLAGGLRLATLRCSCEYEEDLTPFDDVAVRMSLAAIGPSTLTLAFDYVRVREGQADVRVARGEQVITCLRGSGEAVVPAPIPTELREALRPYMRRDG
jgi:enediyne core biosynthesis thioesterase